MNPRPRCAGICALLLVHARLPDYCLPEKVGATFVRLSLDMGKSLVCLRFALYGGLNVPDVMRGLNPFGVAAVQSQALRGGTLDCLFSRLHQDGFQIRSVGQLNHGQGGGTSILSVLSLAGMSRIFIQQERQFVNQ